MKVTTIYRLVRDILNLLYMKSNYPHIDLGFYSNRNCNIYKHLVKYYEKL